tara:strand:- start:1756 stop:2391 length:636 start_codon:yes stop_codon:yes gene_type:complete
MRNYIQEFIGTFFLIFIGVGSIILNDITGIISNLFIGIIFGLTVMIIVFLFGHKSGAHINPAVTIAFWINGSFDGKKVLPYVVSQILASVIASFFLYLIFNNPNTMGETLVKNGNWLQCLFLEIVITFLLMFVILNISVESKKKRLYAGFLIGLVVTLGSIFVGPITGSSMNPARSIGPAFFGDDSFLLMYIFSTIIGAIFAVYIKKSIGR